MADKPRFTVGRVRVVVKSPPLASVRAFTVGKIKNSSRAQNTSSGARQCAVCHGRVVQGMWVHDRDCEHTVVLYRIAGASYHWPCPFQCKPVPLSMGYTHHHTCDFWATHLQVHPL